MLKLVREKAKTSSKNNFYNLIQAAKLTKLLPSTEYQITVTSVFETQTKEKISSESASVVFHTRSESDERCKNPGTVNKIKIL